MKTHCCFKYLLLYSWEYLRQTNINYNDVGKRAGYQNFEFHDPWGRKFCGRLLTYKSYIENALLLQQYSLLLGIDRSDNFVDPGAGVLVFVREDLGHIV